MFERHRKDHCLREKEWFCARNFFSLNDDKQKSFYIFQCHLSVKCHSRSTECRTTGLNRTFIFRSDMWLEVRKFEAYHFFWIEVHRRKRWKILKPNKRKLRVFFQRTFFSVFTTLSFTFISSNANFFLVWDWVSQR